MRPGDHQEAIAFLLSQVGIHSARLWGKALAPLDLDARQVAMLRHVREAEGQSQQAIAAALHIPGSRMVALVDDLERRGLLERRRNPTDRRARALYLTAAGQEALAKIWALSAEHEARLSAGLEPSERQELGRLLRRVAAEQGLLPGVHPGLGYGRRRQRDGGAEGDGKRC